jgi:hypothetical protein
MTKETLAGLFRTFAAEYRALAIAECEKMDSWNRDWNEGHYTGRASAYEQAAENVEKLPA